LNTIALLEPVAKKISLMSAEEKANFKFSLGQNPSLTIYQRIIKKIYGVEKGLEMIELLNNNPVQTLPIVLKRLKQKDDEWKRAQREWNKIWRQVEQRNYWKSLDYQGILFKAKDLSKFRGLIELAQQKRSELAESNHFQYHFNDMHLFKDVSRLVYFFLTRQPVFDQSECDSIRRFMDAFIPQLFDVSDVEPSVGDIAQDIVVEEADEDEDDDVSSVQSTDTAKSKGTNGVRARRKRGQQQNDDDGLRKDVLTKNLKKTSSDSNSSDDTDESDESEQEDEIQHEFKLEVELGRRRSKRVQKKKIMSIQKTNHQKAAPESSAYKSYNMFGSDDFYCFIQLYQMVYERLAKMKSLDAEFKGEPEKAEEARRGACELGITPRRFKGNE
jgi:paired amphipathic helix protein Sin3a